MTSRVDPGLAAAVLASTSPHGRLYGLPDHRYISGPDTARLIRSALRLAFPGVKFAVRTRRSTWSSAVDVDWIDGPTKSAVDAALSGFRGKDFDGMIDLEFTSDCYIDARTGTVGFARTAGSAGSGGVVPASSADVPAGADTVSFMPYIFTDRRTSAAARAAAVAALRPLYGDDFDDNDRVYIDNGDAWRHSGRGLVNDWLSRHSIGGGAA